MSVRVLLCIAVIVSTAWGRPMRFLPISMACGVNNTVRLDTVSYCRLGFVPNGLKFNPNNKVSVLTLGLSPLYASNSDCTRFKTNPCNVKTEEILFGDAGSYACVCRSGLHRPLGDNTPCKQCPQSTPVCPRYTDTAYACPDELQTDGNMCLSTSEYRATPAICKNQVCAHALLYHPHKMLAVKVTACSRSQVRSASGDICECARGYYESVLRKFSCEPCPIGQFCTGRRAKPQNCTNPAQTTQFVAAGDEDACKNKSLEVAVSVALGSRDGIPCPLDFYYIPEGGCIACPAGAVTNRVGMHGIGACVCLQGFSRVDRNHVPNIQDAFACQAEESNVRQLVGAPVMEHRAIAFENEVPIMAWTPVRADTDLLGAVVSFVTASNSFVLVVCSLYVAMRPTLARNEYNCERIEQEVTRDALYTPFSLVSFHMLNITVANQYQAVIYGVHTMGDALFRYDFRVQYATRGGVPRAVLVPHSEGYTALIPQLDTTLSYTMVPLAHAGVLLVSGCVRTLPSIPTSSNTARNIFATEDPAELVTSFVEFNKSMAYYTSIGFSNTELATVVDLYREFNRTVYRLIESDVINRESLKAFLLTINETLASTVLIHRLGAFLVATNATNANANTISNANSMRITTIHYMLHCVYPETNKKDRVVQLPFNSSNPTTLRVVLQRGGLCANVSSATRSVLVALHGCTVVPGAETVDMCGTATGDFVPYRHAVLERLGANFTADIVSMQQGESGAFFMQSEHHGFASFWVAPGLCKHDDARCVHDSSHTRHSDIAAAVPCMHQRTVGGECVSAMRQRGLCAAGYKKHVNTTTHPGERGRCVLCARGFFCEDGVDYECPLESMAVVEGGASVIDCICNAGFFMQAVVRACMPCPMHVYCARGEGVRACPAFSGTENVSAKRESDCRCDAGYFQRAAGAPCTHTPINTYSPAHSNDALLCASGRVSDAGARVCVCPAGKYERSDGECISCREGVPCPPGSTSTHDDIRCDAQMNNELSVDSGQCICTAGNYNVSHAGSCVTCPVGYFCNAARGQPVQECPYEQTSTAGTTRVSDCTCKRIHFTKIGNSELCVCMADYYAVNGNCEPCPHHSTTRGAAGMVGKDACVCENGTSGSSVRAGLHVQVCEPCPMGHFCAFSSVLHTSARHECPPGTFGPAVRQHTLDACLPCPTSSPLSRAASTRPEHCARNLLVFRLGERYDSEFSPTVETVVRAQYRGTILEKEQLRENMVSAIEKAVGVSTDAVYVQMVSLLDTTTVATVTTTPDALEYAVAKLALNSTVWSRVRTLTYVHVNAYELVAHAVFCELVFSTLVRTVSTGTDIDRGDCVTRGVAVPDQADAAAVRNIARLFVDGISSLDGDVPWPAHTSTGVWRWGMDPTLAEILSVVALNLKTPLAKPYWRNAGMLVNRTVIVADAPRGFFVLFVPSADAGVSLALDSNFLRVSTDLYHGVCADAVAGVSGSCASLLNTAGARCDFCQGGVQFQNASTCQPCRQRRCAHGLPTSCCGESDAMCNPSKIVNNSCGNGNHDLLEICDDSANTPLSACCTKSCTLPAGYYSVPSCSTHCGDGIVAKGKEECEPSLHRSNSSHICDTNCMFLTIPAA